MLPKVTVLMTVFNGGRYLKECMDSVLNQTFENFEFLIVDDCSTDNSKDLIESYKDDRIRIIENERNLGQVRSLNTGLDYARGEYIARMDQDDIMMQNRLKKQAHFLDKRQEVSVVGTWGQVMDEEGRVFEKARPPARNEEIIANIFFVGYFLIHPSAMFRKAVVTDAGKYDESLSYAEDYDLWSRLLLMKHKLANIPEFLIKFRYHKENASKKFQKVRLKNTYISISNFIKTINGGCCDSNLDSLHHILIDAGLMNEEYWYDEEKIAHLKESVRLLERFLEKTISYFDLDKSQMCLMKKVFCNKLLNFTYQAAGRKRPSLPLYLFCLKNYPSLYSRPKLYLYPIKSVL